MFSEDDILYEPLKRSDVDEGIQFFANEKFTFFGMQGAILANRTCYDALVKNGPVTVIVAKNREGKIIGQIVSIINPVKYLKGMILRDPHFMIRVIMARIISRIQIFFRRDKLFNATKDLELDIDTVDESLFPYRWNDRCCNFAHSLAMAVSQEERGRGIGRELFLNMFEHVKKKGATDMIACIVYGNLPAVFLHKKVGWQLARSEKSWMAWKRL